MHAGRLFCSLLLAATSLLAADQENHTVRATLSGPSAGAKGQLSYSGDQLVFTSDDRSGISFTIPRADIRMVREAAGVITFDLAKPYSDKNGSHGNLQLTTDPKVSKSVVSWVGSQKPVSVAGDGTVTTTEISTEVEHRHPKGENCTGRLVAGPNNLRYEATSYPGHSREWEYTRVEKFTRNAEANEVKVKPAGGDEYVFRVKGTAGDEPVFNIISQRVTSPRS